MHALHALLALHSCCADLKMDVLMKSLEVGDGAQATEVEVPKEVVSIDCTRLYTIVSRSRDFCFVLQHGLLAVHMKTLKLKENEGVEQWIDVNSVLHIPSPTVDASMAKLLHISVNVCGLSKRFSLQLSANDSSLIGTSDQLKHFSIEVKLCYLFIYFRISYIVIL